DLFWMLLHALKIETPMWVGFNAKILKDNSAKQIVSYLTPINSSPTEKAVVIETMQQSLQVAKECNQTSYIRFGDRKNSITTAIN
ncbi:hypothetical protein ALC57_07898, partial [Trachymyrmex cornetzi]